MSEITVRASSWGALFDCAHRWEWVHMMKRPSKSSLRAALGTAVHAATAAYDKSRMLGQGYTADETAAIVIDSLRESEQRDGINWIDEDISLRNAQRIGINLHETYCTEVSPRFNFVAVELDVNPLKINCDGVTIELRGTLDRSRANKTSSGVGIADLKTGKAAVQKGIAKTRGHAAQLGVYEILYEHTTGTPITESAEIIGLSTAGDNKIGFGKINGAKDILIGTDGDPGLIEYAAAIFKTGLFPPNNQSALCSKKYCPRWDACKFKG